jgi:predicted transcriptional regulator
MKTAVSVPDEIFQLGEAVARRLRISRSQLYSSALAEFLERQKSRAITEKLNEIYSKQPAKLDPAVQRAQLKALPNESW